MRRRSSQAPPDRPSRTGDSLPSTLRGVCLRGGADVVVHARGDGFRRRDSSGFCSPTIRRGPMSGGLGDRPSREDEGLQRIAAEELSGRTGMSFEDAWATLEFQDAAMEVLSDVERALGQSSGEVWFGDDGRRITVGVAGTTTPPSGPQVEAAKRILSARGLLDRADFVTVRWTFAELNAGQERAWELLEPLAHVTNVSPWIEPSTNSVVIETTDDLSAEQLATVEEAVRAAGVSVRVERSLPAPDPSLPPVQMVWTVLSVGEDLRSLLLCYFPAPHLAGEATISVRETEDQIWISIEVPDIRSFPGTIVFDVAVRRQATVRLRSPVGGREITGPKGSPSWNRASYWVMTPEGPSPNLVPRVLGLRPSDASRLLLAQQFDPRRAAGSGRQIVSQEPQPDTPADPGTTVTITAGD